jgi:hypothetical protein
MEEEEEKGGHVAEGMGKILKTILDFEPQVSLYFSFMKLNKEMYAIAKGKAF